MGGKYYAQKIKQKESRSSNIRHIWVEFKGNANNSVILH